VLALALGLASLAACAGAGGAGAAGPARPALAPADQPDLSEGAARQTLGRFARALEAGRWPEAWSLLSPRWRAVTSPERLAADWRGAGPVARESAARAAARLEAGVALEGLAGEGGGPLRLPVGPGRAARLVADGGRWRVDALE